MSEIARHWIDGEWTGSGAVLESVNPATGAVLGRWADGGEAEARAAIAAARRAFETSPWSRDRNLRHQVLNDGQPLRRARRRTRHAGDEGERQEDRRRPVRGDIARPHAPAQRGPWP
jgi:hypothetical protein